MRRLKRETGAAAFVTHELFIVLGVFGVGLAGALALARRLEFGWLGAVGIAVAAVLLIYVGLRLLDVSARRKPP